MTAVATREARLPVAVDAVLGAFDCAVLSGVVRDDGSVTLAGLAPSTRAVDDALASVAALSGAGQVLAASVDVVPAPCAAYALVRRTLSSEAATAPPQQPLARTTVAEGEDIAFKVRTPAFPSHVTADAFMTTGDVVHLDAARWPAAPLPPDAVLAYGGTSGNGVGIRASAPFGTNLVVIVAAARPLMAGPRPTDEAADPYAARLAAALAEAHRAGVPVEPTFLLIETVARDPLGSAAAR